MARTNRHVTFLPQAPSPSPDSGSSFVDRSPKSCPCSTTTLASQRQAFINQTTLARSVDTIDSSTTTINLASRCARSPNRKHVPPTPARSHELAPLRPRSQIRYPSTSRPRVKRQGKMHTELCPGTAPYILHHHQIIQPQIPGIQFPPPGPFARGTSIQD